MPDPAITQRDIALAMGLSQSAVSHALTGSRKVSETTRTAVREYALAHGYRADPMMGALAAYRTGKRKPGFQGTVAWLTNFRTEPGWRLPPFTDYFEGAKAFLETQGYALDTFWMREPGLSPKRVEQILKSRGIESLLLCPQEKSGTVLDLDLDDFSVVTFGFSLQSPALHNVTANGFASMRDLCEELRSRGHRAIGFIYSRESELRSLGSWIGGIHAAQVLDPDHRAVPPFCFDGNPATLGKWFRKHRPDAVISIDPAPREIIQRMGLAIPKDLSFCLTVADPAAGIGGMRFDHRRIGEIAARKLIGLHRARERGIPESPEITAITGIFDAGKTIRKRHNHA